MKGSPEVMSALQEAINLETSLAMTYKLNGKSLRLGFGLKTGKELAELGKQCCCYQKKLLKRLFFLDGTPEISPDTATVAPNVTDALHELLALENNVVDKYTDFVELCYSAKDMSNFHLFQHLVKAHTVGEKGEGHIKYLEHELKQLGKLGENDYIASHI